MPELQSDDWAVMKRRQLRKKDRLKAEIFRKVDRLLRVPQNHGTLFRVAWVIVGILLVLAGLAMTVFPGPALIVIPMGLAMLAGMFAWARKALDMSIDRGVEVERWLAGLDPRVKVLAALAAACLVAAVAALLLLGRGA